MALLLLACTPNGRAQSPQAEMLLPNAPSFQVPDGQTSAQPQQTPAKETPEERARRHAEGDREVNQEVQQRILTVVPNFNTVLNGQGVHLSKPQKTRLAVKATLDPFNVVGAVVLAGVAEITGAQRGYGWGPAGYFKRAGARYADVVDGTMLAGAFYPIVLKQDPRYFRKVTGSTTSRATYALLASFRCRGDNGKPQFNYSNVLGNVTAGLISNTYYPKQDRGIGLSVANSAISLVEGSLGNLGLEFAPDVSAYLQQRKERKRQAKLDRIRDAADTATAGASHQTQPAPQP